MEKTIEPRRVQTLEFRNEETRLPHTRNSGCAFFVAGARSQIKKGDITVGHPWSRVTPQGSAVGVGYVKITNSGKTSDKLTGGTFDGANSVEIHEMKTEDDIMKMRKLSGGIEINPGETIELKPSSYHLMFLGLKAPISEGPNVKGSLNFEKAGIVEVKFKIEPIGAQDSVDPSALTPQRDRLADTPFPDRSFPSDISSDRDGVQADKACDEPRSIRMNIKASLETARLATILEEFPISLFAVANQMYANKLTSPYGR
jgi:copper(I)-binding protein